MTEPEYLRLPRPMVAPLGMPINSAEAVHEVWDTFVKPGQDEGRIQSVEDRTLMSILRAVHEALVDDVGGCTRCSVADELQPEERPEPDQHELAIVLWHASNGAYGYRPGGFTERLLGAWAHADRENRASLARAFPRLGAAVAAIERHGVDAVAQRFNG